MHPGFVLTGLGIETPPAPGVKDIPGLIASKAPFGAISVEAGIDTLLWAVASPPGTLRSGRLYYLRKEHSF